MNKHSVIALLATAPVALAGVALMQGSASADLTTADVRQADFLPALSDTRATGSYDFLEEGLRVRTQGATSTDKVAEYVALTGALPASGALDWTGTAAQPGAQVVFDTDSDRANAGSFNALVGEQVYSTGAPGTALTDWWYTGGSARAASRGITCPSTTGGSGSDCHGTLAQWAEALPAAEVYAGGFSLGSGVQGQGVLRSVSFGDTEYVFTDREAPTAAPTVTETVTVPGPTQTVSVPGPTETVTATATATATVTVTETVTASPEPLPAAAVTGDVDVDRKKRGALLTFASDALADGTSEGERLVWQVVVDGDVAAVIVQASDDTDTFSRTFARKTGEHTITVLKNGVEVESLSINTGRKR